MLKAIMGKRTGAAKAASDARTAVDELRSLRNRLLDQRDRIAARPIPRASAERAVDDSLALWAQEALATISLAPLTRPADGRTPTLPDLSDTQLTALLVTANIGSVADVMKGLLGERYADDDGLEPGVREAECAKLDRQIADCEMAEESAIRDCETAALAVLRRADADPRATLASDRALRGGEL